jgi:hypothetical protein
MFFPLHISSSKVEISFHTEFELPRPAGNTILVVNPILDGGWDWVGWSIVPWSFFVFITLPRNDKQAARARFRSEWAEFFLVA